MLLTWLNHLWKAIVELLEQSLGHHSELTREQDLADLVTDASRKDHHCVVL